ncbi:aspartate aminotransferase family protein [Desulfoluna butyratoxydans]|uniref:Pyridoxal phosphate-dependent transferase n=1 Tax=Desulfoluna butyratoxydans TaxID=231438 RepID=A0A4U8YX64_9BACT|nr:aminotransferase class III-fold pyridoxal phosphate-dependent enzyme [Desulfoluna butyratoxydans]VFQ46033.1 pyridoxal phosphate-dependent transferase [Desulfoluna butyratoxydans]
MTKPGYAISQYHDTGKIYEQLSALISQPIRTLRKDALEGYLAYFEEKCPTSKRMTEDAAKVIPGGVQHNLAFNYPFPLAFTKASGAHLQDVDGNTYIDFLQAGGPTVLGSNPEPVRARVLDLLNTCGPCTGLFHEYEMKLARFICDRFSGVEMFRMLGSGTEACMAAVRVARVATKKKNIIKLGGAYHGWSDQLSYGNRIPGIRFLESHGIPMACFKYTQEVFPNDIEALEKQLKRNRLRGGTAAVFMEPMGPESGTRPLDFDYNGQVRDLCTAYGALLVFDEVVTAFRIGVDGAQGYFGITPDLTIFGKVVAGGYPSAGGIGGKADYMACLAGGLGGKKSKKAHVGGTMAANPLSAAAGYHTVKMIEETNACKTAGKAGDRLTQGLQKLIETYGLPFVAYNQGSICHLETVGTMLFDINLFRPWEIPSRIKEIHARKDVMTHMGAAYMAEGLVTLAGSRLYTSAADTDEIIDDALARFERVFKNIEGVTA